MRHPFRVEGHICNITVEEAPEWDVRYECVQMIKYRPDETVFIAFIEGERKRIVVQTNRIISLQVVEPIPGWVYKLEFAKKTSPQAKMSTVCDSLNWASPFTEGSNETPAFASTSGNSVVKHAAQSRNIPRNAFGQNLNIVPTC